MASPLLKYESKLTSLFKFFGNCRLWNSLGYCANLACSWFPQTCILHRDKTLQSGLPADWI